MSECCVPCTEYESSIDTVVACNVTHKLADLEREVSITCDRGSAAMRYVVYKLLK